MFWRFRVRKVVDSFMGNMEVKPIPEPTRPHALMKHNLTSFDYYRFKILKPNLFGTNISKYVRVLSFLPAGKAAGVKHTGLS
jgi:hypothetical protein